jgi:hypothetical protein
MGILLDNFPLDRPELHLIELSLGVVNDTAVPGRARPTMPSLLSATDQARR